MKGPPASPAPPADGGSLVACPSPELRRAAWAPEDPALPWGEACLLPPGLLPPGLLPPGGAGPGPGWRGQAEGNRTLVLDAPTVPHRGQAWRWSIKGVGARQPLWGDPARTGERALYAESWFGEAPWGAQGDEGVRTALALSDQARGLDLFGMPICPVVAVARLPEGCPRTAARYRRYDGGWWQEQRLVPSAVRLGDQAELTLAFDPDAALAALGVADLPALDAFIDRLLATGLAALTLPGRSAAPDPSRGPQALTALSWVHVWLDKDSVLAPDGALCFADLEGLDRVALADAQALAALARRHLDEHVYELLYAVDRLLALAARWRDRPADAAARRRDLALRLELALDGDPWLQAAPRPDGLDLLLRTPIHPSSPLLLPLLHG
ncbi:hypothetical protein L6R53_28330 [Myxococcota bacterium]|nr:hypothetical protein [Myxococcota bacterium]